MNNPASQKDDQLHTYQYGKEEAVLERLIFSNRPLLLIVFLLATVFFAWQVTKLRPDASFEKMIPMEHPFIQAFMKHMSDLGAAGTTIQVAVENTSGDIFDPEYLDLLQKINDEVFYLPGVDRNRMRSLWTPNVRWIEVTEKGFEGDKVIDGHYDGSAEAMQKLRQNIQRSGEVGRLVADDYRSSIVQAPLDRYGPDIRRTPGLLGVVQSAGTGCAGEIRATVRRQQRATHGQNSHYRLRQDDRRPARWDYRDFLLRHHHPGDYLCAAIPVYPQPARHTVATAVLDHRRNLATGPAQNDGLWP